MRRNVGGARPSSPSIDCGVSANNAPKWTPSLVVLWACAIQISPIGAGGRGADAAGAISTRVGGAVSGAFASATGRGRGIGLANKILAYRLQDEGRDTVEANRELGFKDDLRDYGIGAQILVDLGLTSIRLITNNPTKIIGLEGHGLKVVERVPSETEPGEHNVRYLETKRDKLGHLFNMLQ